MLHAQRLVPHSSASIQSATAEATHYTRVQCWVDTDRDTVRCWSADDATHQSLPKRFATQSGTSISLLLPGGATAAAAWPRLASYFSKFQLSLDLPCSLQVLAPSLSLIPLYVRPVFEEEAAMDSRKTKNKDDGDKNDQSLLSSSKQNRLQSLLVGEGDDTDDVRPSRRISSSPLPQRKIPEEVDESKDWIDPMEMPFLGADEGDSTFPHGSGQQPLNEEEDFDDWIDPMNFSIGGNIPFVLNRTTSTDTKHKNKNDVMPKKVSAAADDSDSSCSISGKPKVQKPLQSAQDIARTRLHRAAQKYLGRDIDVKNVTHATVPIQQPVKPPSSTTGTKNNGPMPPIEERPQLEIGLIVHTHRLDDSEDSSEGNHSGSEDGEMGTASSSSAVMSLVRLVNSVPLLDSAQAVACGLVQGLMEMQKVWNTFGLTITPDPSRRHYESTRLPTFQVKDSDQVAPFFQQHHTHRLHRQRKELDVTWVSEEDDDGSLSHASRSEASPERGVHRGAERLRSRHRRTRRRRRGPRREPDASTLLRPAHSRLGHLLVVCHLRANPTGLPLPTLCKGRLPLDDGPLLAALQAAMTRCLRQLQSSNSALFLTTKQLKTVERNVQFVPALAQAVTSIVTNEVSHHAVVDRYLDKVAITQRRGSNASIGGEDPNNSLKDRRTNMTTKHMLESLIEERLRRNIAQHAEHKKIQKRTKAKKKTKFDRNPDEQEGVHHESEGLSSTGVATDYSLSASTEDEYSQAFGRQSRQRSRARNQGSKKKRIRSGSGGRKTKGSHGAVGALDDLKESYSFEEDGYQEYTDLLFETAPQGSGQAVTKHSQTRTGRGCHKKARNKRQTGSTARKQQKGSYRSEGSSVHEDDYLEYSEEVFGIDQVEQKPPMKNGAKKTKKARKSRTTPDQGSARCRA